ncbi:MAG: prephenate dehydratase domain-containing protein, partial [Gordonia amarae]
MIAYFGPAGTFTEMALQRLLAERLPLQDVPGIGTADVTTIAAANPAATIAMVRSGEADYGCVPIESSLEGSVPATMDALLPVDGKRVQVFAEVSLPIAFTVAAARPLDADRVRRIAAYPVASAQVRMSIEKLYPQAVFAVASSNAGAAADVEEGRADAAITTGLAAELHGLTVLADGVADA